LEDSSTFWEKILKQDYKLKINYLLSLFVIKGVNELLVLFNNTFRIYLKTKKKASHMWGRVMGNLIFKPIS